MLGRNLFIMVLANLAGVAWAANDDIKYQGDKISFPVNVRGTAETNNHTAVCIPRGTALRGLSDLTQTGLRVRIANVFGKPVDCDTQQPISADEAILLSQQTVTDSAASRYGLTYGGLVVPFKYYFNGDGEFRSGGTVAPYVGYRFDRDSYGFGMKFIGFLGGAGVPVEQTVDGVAKTQTLAGMSYGIGLLGTLKGDFQMGIVVGADRVSRSVHYVNNGKWWAALGVGFSFAD